MSDQPPEKIFLYRYYSEAEWTSSLSEWIDASKVDPGPDEVLYIRADIYDQLRADLETALKRLEVHEAKYHDVEQYYIQESEE